MEESQEKILKAFSSKRVITIKRITKLRRTLKSISRYPKRLKVPKDKCPSINEESELLLQTLDQTEDFVHHIGRILLGEKHG